MLSGIPPYLSTVSSLSAVRMCVPVPPNPMTRACIAIVLYLPSPARPHSPSPSMGVFRVTLLGLGTPRSRHGVQADQNVAGGQPFQPLRLPLRQQNGVGLLRLVLPAVLQSRVHHVQIGDTADAELARQHLLA